MSGGRVVTSIPMYDPAPAMVNASHGVFSPGGYESWRFEAEEVKEGVRLSIGFHIGLASQGEYMRRYRRFVRRPLSNIPPRPNEYCATTFVAYRGTEILRATTWECVQNDVEVSSECLSIRMGEHCVRQGKDGIYRIEVDGANLTFEPCAIDRPLDITAMKRTLGEEHRWIVAPPLCRVHGSVDLGGLSFDFEGVGYHDHFYGPRPFLERVGRASVGSVFFPERVIAFLMAGGKESPDEVDGSVIEVTRNGVRGIADIAVDASSGGTLRFGELLVLSDAEEIQETAHGRTLVYRARAGSDEGSAIVETMWATV